MARLSFLIERDHLAEEAGIASTDVGLFHTRNRAGNDRMTEAGLAQLKAAVVAEGMQFRLYDDDDVLYYTGRHLMPTHLQKGEDLFNPLDWAMGHAGCTRIDYLNTETGEWETI